MTEHPVLVPVGESVIGGIISGPVGQPTAAAVVLPGGLGFRFGPNRLWARLARDLAGLGLVVFRPDYPGTGDSDPVPGTAANRLATLKGSVDWFRERAGGLPTLLVGNCYGARLALLLSDEPGVVALALVNPWLVPPRGRRSRTLLRRAAGRPVRAASKLLRRVSGRGRRHPGWTGRDDPELVRALGQAASRMPVRILVGEEDVALGRHLAVLSKQIEGLEVERASGVRLGAWGQPRSQEETLDRLIRWAEETVPLGIRG
jgi:alpha-beta hydrolase superfamily lysophospholipase